MRHNRSLCTQKQPKLGNYNAFLLCCSLFTQQRDCHTYTCVHNHAEYSMHVHMTMVTTHSCAHWKRIVGVPLSSMAFLMDDPTRSRAHPPSRVATTAVTMVTPPKVRSIDSLPTPNSSCPACSGHHRDAVTRSKEKASRVFPASSWTSCAGIQCFKQSVWSTVQQAEYGR